MTMTETESINSLRRHAYRLLREVRETSDPKHDREWERLAKLLAKTSRVAFAIYHRRRQSELISGYPRAQVGADDPT